MGGVVVKQNDLKNDLQEQAEYYRDVAAQLLAVAGGVMDPMTKGELLDIAIGFLNLADHAERRLHRT